MLSVRECVYGSEKGDAQINQNHNMLKRCVRAFAHIEQQKRRKLFDQTSGEAKINNTEKCSSIILHYTTVG